MAVLRGVVCLLLLLALVYSFPNPTNSPDEDEPEFESKRPEGCYVNVTRTYNTTETIYDYDIADYVDVPTEVTVIAQDCCKGYAGDNCDIKLDLEEDGPCGNLTCDGYPTARCAIVRHCGTDIPLFLDDSKRVIMECLSQDICLGTCLHDPCAAATCDKYPQALCFSDVCKCTATWYLPETKERVSCNKDLVKREEARTCGSPK